jgi:hypothetical protein
VVDAIVRELRLGGGVPRGAGDRARSAAAHAVGGFRFVVDFDTPERWPDVAYDTAAAPSRHDDAARVRIACVLGEAAQTMAARAPRAMQLVDRQLQRVLLRRNDGAPGTSASHRDHVGCCLLTKLHAPAAAAAVRIAIEALTHEATHQLLYRTEQASGNFCDLAETPTYRSPWSGARLPLHSLVHASFVWFGLLTLWIELAQAPASEDEALHARGRIAHCLFGFAFLEDLLDSPAFPTASVDAQVLASLRDMAGAARRATRAAEPQAALRQAALARSEAGWPAALAASRPAKNIA